MKKGKKTARSILFPLDRAFNEFPVISFSTPSLSRIIGYYINFPLDRTFLSSILFITITDL